MNRQIPLVLIVAPVLAGLSPALGDTATESLIREVTRAARTPAEKAVRLYEAAQMVEDDASLQAKLLAEAAEQGLDGVAEPAGRETAEKAFDELAEKQPDNVEHWNAKRLELYRRWYRVAGADEKKRVGRKLIDLLVAEGERLEQGGKWGETVAPLGEASTLAAYLRLREQDRLKHRHHRAAYLSTVERRIAAHKAALEKNPPT